MQGQINSSPMKILPSKTRADGVRISIESSSSTLPLPPHELGAIREEIRKIASTVRSLEFILIPCDPLVFDFIAQMIIQAIGGRLHTLLIEDAGGDVEELCLHLYDHLGGTDAIDHLGIIHPGYMDEIPVLPRKCTFLRTEPTRPGEEDGYASIPDSVEEVRFLKVDDPIPYIPASVTSLHLGKGWIQVYLGTDAEEEEEEEEDDDVLSSDSEDAGEILLPWNREDGSILNGGGCAGVKELTLEGDIVPKSLPAKLEHLVWIPGPGGMTRRGVDGLANALRRGGGMTPIRKLTMRASFAKFSIMEFPLAKISHTKLERIHLIIHSDELLWNDRDVAKLIRENKKLKALLLDVEGDGIGPSSKKIIEAIRDHPSLQAVRVISSYEKHREYVLACEGGGAGGKAGGGKATVRRGERK